LVEKQTVAAPAGPSFGTEETSDSEEKLFSQADTQVDFAAQEAKLARRKNFAVAEESFPSLRYRFDPATAVGLEVVDTESVEMQLPLGHSEADVGPTELEVEVMPHSVAHTDLVFADQEEQVAVTVGEENALEQKRLAEEDQPPQEIEHPPAEELAGMWESVGGYVVLVLMQFGEGDHKDLRRRLLQ
jgi:hypothetical protein